MTHAFSLIIQYQVVHILTLVLYRYTIGLTLCHKGSRNGAKANFWILKKLGVRGLVRFFEERFPNLNLGKDYHRLLSIQTELDPTRVFQVKQSLPNGGIQSA